MSDRASFIEKLNEVHDFPGPYTLKVIGPNHDVFAARVIQCLLHFLDPQASPDVSSRTSSKGTHLSLTITFEVVDAEVVANIYEAVQALDEVRYLL